MTPARSATAVVLAALLSLSGLGCDDGTDARADGAVQIELVGWGTPEEREVVRRVLRTFEERNPGVTVRYVQVAGTGYDYVNRVRLMVVGGIAPDVFYVPDGAFGAMVSQGVLRPVGDMVAASEALDLEEMWQTGVDRYRFDGRNVHRGDLYCLPKDIGPTVMFYNAELFRARGLPLPSAEEPLTWAEALETWKALTYREGGIQHYGVTAFPYEAAVWSSGGEILRDGRWVLDEPKGAAALQWVADLSLVHRVAPNPARGGSSGSAELFEAGLAAMHFDGRWMVPRFREMDFEWDVAPVPVPERGAPSVSWSGSVGLCIAQDSPHAEAAFRLIEFLAGPEGQTELTRTGLQVPNQRWLAESEVFLQPDQRPAHAEVFLAAAETSRPPPASALPNAFWHDVFWTYVGRIWRGERRADEYLRELSPLVNQTLREKNPLATEAP